MHKSCSPKTLRKKPLARTGYRWKDIMKVDVAEIGFERMDWTHLAQNSD
jgi:hypothetical protein